MALSSAPLCRADSPVACSGRRAERERGPGVWLDPDRLVWLWSPVLNGEPTGISEVTHCPHCGGPLPRVGQVIPRVLSDPDEEC